MAISIKNERVEQLLDEITSLTGEGKTEAIRRALEERRQRLQRGRAELTRADRLHRLLHRELWPNLPPHVRSTTMSRAEEEALLGFGPDGV
ncbi:MAG: type II toxin-antitoxin system VapB family antitoxin [Gemmatimonadales bacterium]|nr:type II toxin-antitoxin system VapB family antitoxin [Gemmatimonadales bacterium]